MNTKHYRRNIRTACANKHLIVAGLDDATIEVYDSSTGNAIVDIFVHINTINTVFCIDDIFMVGGYDGKLTIWNIDTFKKIKTLDCHGKSIYCVHANDKYIVYADHQFNINVFDRKTFEFIKTIHCKRDEDLDMQSSYKLVVIEDTIIYFGFEPELCVYNIKTDEVETFKDSEESEINSMCMIDNILIIGCEGGSLEMWKYNNGHITPIGRINLESGEIYVLYAKDGLIFAGSEHKLSNIINVIDLNTFKHIKTINCVGYIYSIMVIDKSMFYTSGHHIVAHEI